jgi:hypothetical protein
MKTRKISAVVKVLVRGKYQLSCDAKAARDQFIHTIEEGGFGECTFAEGLQVQWTIVFDQIRDGEDFTNAISIYFLESGFEQPFSVIVYDSEKWQGRGGAPRIRPH